MRTAAIVNLKGGVGKSTTAINLALIMATVYKYRVLLVDNDIQANVSKFFGVHSCRCRHKRIKAAYYMRIQSPG